MVAEVVSPSSVNKDYRELPVRYHAAGIPEFWLLDGLGEEAVFEILRHTPNGYESVPGRDGWIASAVFGREFRLERRFDPLGLWLFRIHVRSPGSA
jgi:Uma2 family endonuclease